MRRRLNHKLAACAVAALFAATPFAAQTPPFVEPATLIADDIQFSGGSSVRASGSVEIFFDNTRLRARSVSYDREGDLIEIEGPITIVDATGDEVIAAEFAELSTDLQNGVLTSARLVLDRQVQIAATEAQRSGGRYTQLHQAVASACDVCSETGTPLWEIRARRVIHDAEEQQLYFDDAQFRVFGLPVFYLPSMRLPDPGLERATGFLAPSMRVSDLTGTQLRVPYFIMLGDHADLTLTPWIGSETATLEMRYRQAFHNGFLTANGAISFDDLTDQPNRGYVFANAGFGLSHGFQLDLQAQAVSDRGYLTTYDFPKPDILESFAQLRRVRSDEYIGASATLFQSLRGDEDNDVLPTHVGEAEIIRRYQPGLIGGTLTADLSASAFFRPSDEDGPNGRDVLRAVADVNWRRSETFGGLLASVETALNASVYHTDQGGALNGTETRLVPYGALELRYPLQSVSGNGVRHVIEPVAQIVWSDAYGDEVPNEDSFLVELDEANLFALNRFPGEDLQETGLRANVGLGYTRHAPDGWSIGVTGGMVFRDEEQLEFTDGSGLDGVRSDFLLTTHVTYQNRLAFVNRAIFDANFDFTSSELSLVWHGERHHLGTTYTYLEADPGEDRPRDTGEWAFDASYGLASGWDAGVNWRYDFVEDGPTSAGLSLGYENECVDMEFSVNRRYTSSSSVEPSTSFDVTVSLTGFGGGNQGRSTSRSCRG